MRFFLPVINKLKGKDIVVQQEGFTLIELLVVILIASVLAALAAPSFLGMYNRSKLNNASDSIRSTIYEAQKIAIRKSNTCDLNVVTNSTETRIQSTINKCFEDRILTVKDGVLMKYQVSVIGGLVPLAFDYEGDAGNSMLFIIYMNGIPTKKCILVTENSGLIRTGNFTGDVSTITSGTMTNFNTNKNACVSPD